VMAWQLGRVMRTTMAWLLFENAVGCH
jgi:hypothetical protein